MITYRDLIKLQFFEAYYKNIEFQLYTIIVIDNRASYIERRLLLTKFLLSIKEVISMTKVSSILDNFWKKTRPKDLYQEYLSEKKNSLKPAGIIISDKEWYESHPNVIRFHN